MNPDRKPPYSEDLRCRMIWQRVTLDYHVKAVVSNLGVDPSIVSRQVFTVYTFSRHRWGEFQIFAHAWTRSITLNFVCKIPWISCTTSDGWIIHATNLRALSFNFARSSCSNMLLGNTVQAQMRSILDYVQLLCNMHAVSWPLNSWLLSRA